MNIKIEVKSQQNCIKTKTGLYKKTVANIKLMNSLGDCSTRSLQDVIKFDKLLVIDTGSRQSYCAGYISASDIETQYLDLTKDGVILKNFPLDKVIMIYNDSENKNKIILKENNFSYLEKKREIQRKLIEEYA